MNLFKLFQDSENYEGFTLTGGKCLEENPDCGKEILNDFKNQVKQEALVLYLIKSFDGDGEYAEGSLVAVDQNHNIISEQGIWRS